MGRVTLQTIADRVGVSRMTVSNAFSRPDQLSARLRDQILAVADELGYVGPDPTARALASGTAGAVGLLLSDTLPYALTDEVAMQFMAGIADELGSSGLALTLLSAAPRDGRSAGAGCRDRRCVGLFLRSRLLGRRLADASPASAGIRRSGAGTRHSQHQRRRPAGGPRRSAASGRPGAPAGGNRDDWLRRRVRDRHQSARYRSSRMRSGNECWVGSRHSARRISSRSSCASHTPIPKTTGTTVCRQFSTPAVGPRGSCVSPTPSRAESSALFATRAYAFPRTFRSIGFDDNPIARRMQPALTTVRQDAQGKGRAAAAALISAIAHAGGSTRTPRSAPLASHRTNRSGQHRPTTHSSVGHYRTPRQDPRPTSTDDGARGGRRVASSRRDALLVDEVAGLCGGTGLALSRLGLPRPASVASRLGGQRRRATSARLGDACSPRGGQSARTVATEVLAGHTVIVTSDTRREVGVEEEFLLIDSTRLRAMPDGEAVVAEASRRLPEFSGDGHGVAQEFKREQVETGSAPRRDLAELESDLAGLRTASVGVGADAGPRACGSGDVSAASGVDDITG